MLKFCPVCGEELAMDDSHELREGDFGLIRTWEEAAAEGTYTILSDAIFFCPTLEKMSIEALVMVDFGSERP